MKWAKSGMSCRGGGGGRSQTHLRHDKTTPRALDKDDSNKDSNRLDPQLNRQANLSNKEQTRKIGQDSSNNSSNSKVDAHSSSSKRSNVNKGTKPTRSPRMLPGNTSRKSQMLRRGLGWPMTEG